MSEWIPVGERLPEEKEPVLVAVKNARRAKEACLISRSSRRVWRVWGGEYDFSSVTHWKPMPPLPKQDGGK